MRESPLVMPSESSRETRGRVLVVDDDRSLLEGLVMMLESEHYDPYGASTFEEARERLRGEAFNALLTDVRLGAFNGLQLAVIARAMHPGTKIIIISGYDDPVLRAEAAQLGAVYFVKPIAFTEILSALKD